MSSLDSKKSHQSQPSVLFVVACFIFGVVLLLTFLQHGRMSSIYEEDRGGGRSLITHQAVVAPPQRVCYPQNKYIPPIKTRAELAGLLQMEGMEVGAELGVQYGLFAVETLRNWPLAKRYYLVDLWGHQENYNDVANADAKKQEFIFSSAKKHLAPWHHKVVYLRNYTTQAVHDVHEELDYVYVDARHDFCGVMEDLEAWWPKIKPGGIMAGHDYMSATEVKHISKQDWSLCGDGSVNMGAVVGAVEAFFSKRNLQPVITYREQHFNTWIVRKPHMVCGAQFA